MLRTISKALTGRASLTRSMSHLSQLDLPIDQLKRSLRGLPKQANMVQALRDISTSKLYSEVSNWSKKQYGDIPRSGDIREDPRARNAAGGHALCYALNAVVHLSHEYDLKLVPRNARANDDAEATEREFLSQIHPSHADKLLDEFLRSWKANPENRQAALLSVLLPGLAMKLGLNATHAHSEHAKAWGIIPPSMLLTEGQLLALVDYVNSETGTFNAVNGAALADAYYGEPVLQQMMGTFTATLDLAIHKLCRHPYFGLHDVKTYKGICLYDESGLFRRAMLDAAVKTDKVIAFPNVLSATANPSKSYAVTKAQLGYSLELEITMRTGFDADPFHDTKTMGEGEVIGPRGQKFIVTDKVEVEEYIESAGRSEFIDRYLLKPAR